MYKLLVVLSFHLTPPKTTIEVTCRQYHGGQASCGQNDFYSLIKTGHLILDNQPVHAVFHKTYTLS